MQFESIKLNKCNLKVLGWIGGSLIWKYKVG